MWNPTEDEYIEKIDRPDHWRELEAKEDFFKERISDLPVSELTILNLVFWKREPEANICRALGITLESMKELKTSALKRLRDEFRNGFPVYARNRQIVLKNLTAPEMSF
jgi:DNA-directed RNA polymerase specialized sigma subunit